MDCETIDNFKLSRLEIILDCLFNLRLFKSRTGFDISSLSNILIGLVVVGMIIGVGTIGLYNFNSGAGTVSTSTSFVNVSSTISAEVANIMGGWLGLIVTVAILSVGLSLVVGVFASSGTDSEDKKPSVSVDKLKEKEEEYNENYYKGEPDFDDAKKSFWDKYIKRYRK